MTSQTRRSLLSAVGVTALSSASGCIGSLPLIGREDVDPLTLSVIEVDDDPDPLALDVEVQNDILDAEHAPTLSISLENMSEETIGWDEVSSGTYSGTPFTSSLRAIPGRSLALVAGKWSSENEEGCVSTSIADDSLADLRTEIDAGDRLKDEFSVIGIDENLDDPCPEPGSYRFEHSWRDRSGEDFRSWLWGFEVELMQP